jgi:DNA polymerase III subunit delta'
MSFASFIGNTIVVQRLRTKLRESRFPHALIFAGPEGVGKHTLARMVAKALNCGTSGPSDFCNECSACRKIDAGTHPDVLSVTVAEDATQIKIVQIRQILSTLGMHPLEGRNKVFIMDPANLLTAESGNALLKGLEEPPDNSFFILICVNLHELLITIRSRCQVYHFSPLTLEDIRGRGIHDELAVRWSQGSIGRAQSLDLVVIKEQREAVLGLVETAVNAKDETLRDMLAASVDLSRTRQDFSSYLAVMAVLLRDLLHIAEGMPDKIVNIDLRERLERTASRAETERWIRVSDFLRVMEAGVKGHWNRQLMTDTMALMTAEISDDNRGKSR